MPLAWRQTRMLLTAQTNQLSAASPVASLDGGLLKLKLTLCTLTGWAADTSPELAPILRLIRLRSIR
ncbi:MAG: hypothetical protein ACLTA4_12090 [Clostridium sp.]